MRTWEDNRRAINQLWPQCQWTDEERKLWSDDLSPLDQPTLYDAIRNVKRNNDTLYPQLKWFRDEYRELNRLRLSGVRRPAPEPRRIVDIAKEGNDRLAGELRAVIELASPADWQTTVDLIAEKAAACKIEMATACRLVRYLNERLGMARGGRVA